MKTKIEDLICPCLGAELGSTYKMCQTCFEFKKRRVEESLRLQAAAAHKPR